MPVERFEPLTPEEFDQRLEASNERLRLELIEAEERLRKREIIVARKEPMLRYLDQTLADIEREENEIAALEKELPSPHRPARRPQPLTSVRPS